VIGVRSTDLSIRANRLTALVGPSGSGKTTLLRLLSGLESPTSGRILFDETDVTDLPPKARRVGVVFQGYALFRHMTVAENIKFGPRMLNLPGDHDARVAELLDLVELPHIAGRLPGQLSGGQKQRVALARALAAEPRLLLLDEPFSALDPEVRRALRAGLRDILDRAGVTAIMVSHDQEEAFAMADDVVIFNRGSVQQTGSPADVRASPASPFVMDFVHEANKLPSDCIFTRRMGVRAGGRPYVMCAPGDVAAHRWPPGGPRPAHADAPLGGAALPPSSSTTTSSPPPVHVGATVIDKSFGGAVRKYVLEFDDGVRLAAHVPTAAGDDGDLEVSARAYVRCEPGAFLPFDVDDLLT
jgi:sulfate/thiosulfate transport system ATP-binding protein